MPIKAQRVEYPLVAVAILDVLRQARLGDMSGNALRMEVAQFACPEAKGIQPRRVSDGYHAISDRLQGELDSYYRHTEFGKRVGWEVPTHSGNLTSWGQWSTALLVQKLIDGGTECNWKGDQGR